MSDGQLQTEFVLDITQGDYVLTNVCDENGNSFGNVGSLCSGLEPGNLEQSKLAIKGESCLKDLY